MQPKQGGASDPAGMQLENVALSSIFPDPMFASLGRGFLPTVVTAESDRSIEPTMWTLEEGDDGACMVSLVFPRSGTAFLSRTQSKWNE